MVRYIEVNGMLSTLPIGKKRVRDSDFIYDDYSELAVPTSPSNIIEDRASKARKSSSDTSPNKVTPVKREKKRIIAQIANDISGDYVSSLNGLSVDEDSGKTCNIPTGLFNVLHDTIPIHGYIVPNASSNEKTTRDEFAFKIYIIWTTRWKVSPEDGGADTLNHIIDQETFRDLHDQIDRSVKIDAGDEEDPSFRDRKVYLPEKLYEVTINHKKTSDVSQFAVPSWEILTSQVAIPEGKDINNYELIVFVRPKNGFCGEYKQKKVPVRLNACVASMDDDATLEGFISNAFITTAKAFPGKEGSDNATRAAHIKKVKSYQANVKSDWIDNGKEGTKNRLCFHPSECYIPLQYESGEGKGVPMCTPKSDRRFLKTAGFITASGDNQKSLWSESLEAMYVAEFITNNTKSQSYFHFRVNLKDAGINSSSSGVSLKIQMVPCTTSPDQEGAAPVSTVYHLRQVDSTPPRREKKEKSSLLTAPVLDRSKAKVSNSSSAASDGFGLLSLLEASKNLLTPTFGPNKVGALLSELPFFTSLDSLPLPPAATGC